jgi:hypothetical protein
MRSYLCYKELAVAAITRPHAKVTLEKTSDQVKLLMKEKVDESANSTTPYITAPCKAGANLTLPAPAACIVNTGITSCVEPAITAGMKKVGHKYVDQCIDTEAKKVIDQSIDSSVDSTKSFLTMICDYVQSKFA